MKTSLSRIALLTLASLAFAAAAGAATGPSALSPNWVGSWASSQQIPEPRNALPPDQLTNATLRQIVHLTLGGQYLRVRVSNAFGTAPLRISAVHIARPVSLTTGRIDPATDTAVTFNGRPAITIPPGAEYLSDPVHFPVQALSDLAVSMYFKQPPARQTSHPGSRETSFLVHGDHVSAAVLDDPVTVDHWFQLSGVEVYRPGAWAVVALGDSITDGHAAGTNRNQRWPDDLARRFQSSPSTRNLSVLNEGTGGNRLLLYGLAQPALARFDRDVAGQAHVRAVILLEGINDLGMMTRTHPVIPPAMHHAMVRNLIGAYSQIIARAHALGIRVIGCTIMPDGGNGFYHPDAAINADRHAINAWIRTPGHFDAVVDFSRLVQDPAHPDRLRPADDSGDHLHPGPAGYRAMAAAIPLSLFTTPFTPAPIARDKAIPR